MSTCIRRICRKSNGPWRDFINDISVFTLQCLRFIPTKCQCEMVFSRSCKNTMLFAWPNQRAAVFACNCLSVFLSYPKISRKLFSLHCSRSPIQQWSSITVQHSICGHVTSRCRDADYGMDENGCFKTWHLSVCISWQTVMFTVKDEHCVNRTNQKAKQQWQTKQEKIWRRRRKWKARYET